MADAAYHGRRPLLVPELGYVDARSAVVWLTDILGLRTGVVIDGSEGAITHAELWWKDSAVYVETVGSVDERGRCIVCLAAGDNTEVDRVYERVLQANAEVTFPLTDTPFGSHQFAVRDPEGHTWTVGTYQPTPPSAEAAR